MKQERTMTLHPRGKEGVNISRAKYSLIRRHILEVLAERGEILFRELPDAVEASLDEPFDGSIPWYVTTIKLDLEARDLVYRVPGSSPQRLKLTPRA